MVAIKWKTVGFVITFQVIFFGYVKCRPLHMNYSPEEDSQLLHYDANCKDVCSSCDGYWGSRDNMCVCYTSPKEFSPCLRMVADSFRSIFPHLFAAAKSFRDGLVGAVEKKNRLSTRCVKRKKHEKKVLIKCPALKEDQSIDHLKTRKPTPHDVIDEKLPALRHEFQVLPPEGIAIIVSANDHHRHPHHSIAHCVGHDDMFRDIERRQREEFHEPPPQELIEAFNHAHSGPAPVLIVEEKPKYSQPVMDEERTVHHPYAPQHNAFFGRHVHAHPEHTVSIPTHVPRTHITINAEDGDTVVPEHTALIHAHVPRIHFAINAEDGDTVVPEHSSGNVHTKHSLEGLQPYFVEDILEELVENVDLSAVHHKPLDSEYNLPTSLEPEVNLEQLAVEHGFQDGESEEQPRINLGSENTFHILNEGGTLNFEVDEEINKSHHSIEVDISNHTSDKDEHNSSEEKSLKTHHESDVSSKSKEDDHIEEENKSEVKEDEFIVLY